MSANRILKWAGITALAGAAAAVCYKAFKKESQKQKDVVLEYTNDDFGTMDFEIEDTEVVLSDEDRAAAEAAFEELEAREAEVVESAVEEVTSLPAVEQADLQKEAPVQEEKETK